MRWLIASFIIFIFGLFNFFAPVRGVIQYLMNPLQYGFQESAVGIKDWFGFYRNLRSIRNENLELMSKVDLLTSELLALKDASEENALLKEQLNVTTIEDIHKGLVLTQTLGNQHDKTSTSIVLDKGSLHEVSVDDLVIQGGYLIGIVREVTQQRSVVELITSPTLSISVLDQETKTEGLSQGAFGTSLSVNRVLPGENVAVGDTFITSGRDGVFPPGYIIGEVTQVSNDSAEALRAVNIKTLLDFERLGKVFVIPGK